MNLIYNYHPETGEYLGQAVANVSPREEDVVLVPAFAALEAPPAVGARQCACYLDAAGQVPTDYQDGAWQVVVDWRGVPLWDTGSGEPVVILLPGITPAEIGATDIERPSVTMVWDGAGWVVDAALAEKHLLDLRASRLEVINMAAEDALSRLASAYHDGEVKSWAKQEAEALALQADPGAPVPMLTGIAAKRGLDTTELAARVLAKVATYTAAASAIIGQRQALEDALMAIDLQAQGAAEQLETIQWPA